MAEAFSHTVCFFFRFLTLVSCFFTKLYFALFCIGCVYYLYIWFIRVEVFFFCPFILLLLSLLFSISNSCRQRQKNQLCAYKKSVPMFNFWLCDLHVQLFRSSINWQWHYYSVQHGVGYFNVCFFSLLFYASLKRDILVLPGYSVSFDQIIYFQCKTQRLWRLQNFSIQLIVQRESSGNWLNEEWFYKWNVFFVRCRHKTHYFFN